MFAYGTAQLRRAVDLVTGPGNIYVAAAKRLLKGRHRHRLRGRPDRDRRSWPTTPPTRPHVAADLISQAEHDPHRRLPCWSPTATQLADAVEAELGRQVAGDQARRADRATALAGQQSAIVLVDDLDAGAARSSTRTPPSTWRSITRDAARAWPPGCATPARSSSGPYAPVSLGDYCAGSNHVLPTGGCACHSSGLSVQPVPARHPRRRVRPGRAGATVAGHVVALGGAEDLPAHVRRRARPRAQGRLMAGLDDLPLRDDLRGRTPYGAPQLDVPVRLNVNENPYPPSAALVADIAAAVAEVAGGLNRYPDREATGLRPSARRLTWPTASGVAAPVEQVWAANGSNEVMHAAAAGLRRARAGWRWASPRPTRCTRTTARDTFTGYVTGRARAGLHPRPRTAAVAAVRDAPAGRRAAGLAEQPDRHGAAAGRRRGGVRGGARAWSSSTRRTRSSGAPARPARSTLLPDHPRLVVTRTMSKAFALAGARLGYLVAAPAVVDAVRLVRLPYHLSAVTQAVAAAALRPRRRAAGHRRRAARGARRAWSTGCAARGLDGGRLATPTSCCSGRSPTGTRSGRVCSTAACSSGRPARTAGCGSRVGTPEEIDVRRSCDAPLRGGQPHEPRRARVRARDQGERRPRRARPRRHRRAPTSRPACRSSTTCWPSSASTAGST